MVDVEEESEVDDDDDDDDDELDVVDEDVVALVGFGPLNFRQVLQRHPTTHTIIRFRNIKVKTA